MELYKNLCEDIENNHGKIVIYDRGILDRLPWYKQLLEKGEISEEEFEIFNQMYKLKIAQEYKPIAYNFITSPELSIYRKGKEGKFVNKKAIENFNGHLDTSREFFKEKSSNYREIYTDEYQGHLQEFIIDVVNDMTIDLCNEIKKDERLNEIEK